MILEYTVHKTYPRRDPGSQRDANYFVWLRELEPVVIRADPSRLQPKTDWIQTGESVLSFAVDDSAGGSRSEAIAAPPVLKTL